MSKHSIIKPSKDKIIYGSKKNYFEINKRDIIAVVDNEPAFKITNYEGYWSQTTSETDKKILLVAMTHNDYYLLFHGDNKLNITWFKPEEPIKYVLSFIEYSDDIVTYALSNKYIYDLQSQVKITRNKEMEKYFMMKKINQLIDLYATGYYPAFGIVHHVSKIYDNRAMKQYHVKISSLDIKDIKDINNVGQPFIKACRD